MISNGAGVYLELLFSAGNTCFFAKRVIVNSSFSLLREGGPQAVEEIAVLSSISLSLRALPLWQKRESLFAPVDLYAPHYTAPQFLTLIQLSCILFVVFL